MAELSEAEKKSILGKNYRPPDPNAPKPHVRVSAVRRIWGALRGKSAKS
jgi:hypothetical protein